MCSGSIWGDQCFVGFNKEEAAFQWDLVGVLHVFDVIEPILWSVIDT